MGGRRGRGAKLDRCGDRGKLRGGRAESARAATGVRVVATRSRTWAPHQAPGPHPGPTQRHFVRLLRSLARSLAAGLGGSGKRCRAGAGGPCPAGLPGRSLVRADEASPQAHPLGARTQ